MIPMLTSNYNLNKDIIELNIVHNQPFGISQTRCGRTQVVSRHCIEAWLETDQGGNNNNPPTQCYQVEF